MVKEVLGIPIKWLSLITLVVQNSALVIIMKYSRSANQPRYLASTAVVMSELIKFLISSFVFATELKKQGKLSASHVNIPHISPYVH
jgi:hypothetical protein